MRPRATLPLLAAATIAALWLATGCRSSKPSGGKAFGGTALERLQATVDSYGEWSTFKASGKISLGAGKPLASSMRLTMVKGEEIEISIRPLLGIEMGKIHITSDSIIILNKAENYYIAESLGLIANGMPLNVSDMQSLFLARMFELGTGGITAQAASLESLSLDTGQNLLAKFRPDSLPFDYTFAVDTLCQLQSLSACLDNGQNALTVDYSGFSLTDSHGAVANKVLLSSLVNDTQMWLKLEYNSVEWDKSVTTGVKIGKNCKRLPGEALLTAFSQQQ